MPWSVELSIEVKRAGVMETVTGPFIWYTQSWGIVKLMSTHLGCVGVASVVMMTYQNKTKP